MKKKIILVLTFILSLCLLFSLGCSGGESEPPKASYEVSFINPPKTMIMGEMKKLTYFIEEGGEEESVSFTSSNPSVATIDNGANLDAINVGQTVITASCGENKTEFTLTVVRDDGLPQFLFSNYINENEKINLTTNQKINVDGYILYNGREYNDGDINFEVDNKEVLSVASDGTVTALGKGEAVITITASWRGIDSPLLSKELTVGVVNDAQILLEEGAVTDIKLFTVSEFLNNSYATSYNLTENAKFYVNGEDVTASATFELVDNKSVVNENAPAVTIDGDKVITSSAYGSARLKATYNFNGEELSHSVEVSVERPLSKYDKTIYFSKVDGEIDELEQMFGGSVTLIDAYQGNGRALTLEGNKITDYQLSEPNEKNKDTITVYSAEGGITVDVISVYKVIRTAEDLKSLYNDGTTRGYFLVANDIAYDENVAITPRYTSHTDGSIFLGTFDGDGHTIEYGITKGGLFGILKEDAKVRNASFVVKAIHGDDDMVAKYAILAGYMERASIQNIYATYDIENFEPIMAGKVAGNNYTRGLGLFAMSHGGYIMRTIVDLSNVIMDEPNGKTTLVRYGVLSAPVNSGYSKSTNTDCYVVWTVKQIIHQTSSSGSFSRSGVAENDEYPLTNKPTNELISGTGVKRYNTLADLANALNGEKVSNFEVKNVAGEGQPADYQVIWTK